MGNSGFFRAKNPFEMEINTLMDYSLTSSRIKCPQYVLFILLDKEGDMNTIVGRSTCILKNSI